MASHGEKIEKELDKVKKNLLEIFPHIREQAIQRKITHYRSKYNFPLHPPVLLQLCVTDFLEKPASKEDLVVPMKDTVDSSDTFDSGTEEKLEETKLIDSDDDLFLIEAADIMDRDSQFSLNSDVIVLDSVPIVGQMGSGQTSDLTQHYSKMETNGPSQILISEMEQHSTSRAEMKNESINWDGPLPKVQIGLDRQTGKSMLSSSSSQYVFTNIKLNLGNHGNHHKINKVNCQNSFSAMINAQNTGESTSVFSSLPSNAQNTGESTSVFSSLLSNAHNTGESTSVLSSLLSNAQQSSNILSTNLTGLFPSTPLGQSLLFSFSPSTVTFSPNDDLVSSTQLPGFPLSSHYNLDIQTSVSTNDPPAAVSSQTHFDSSATNIGQRHQSKMNTSVNSDTTNQTLPRLLSKTSIQHKTYNKCSFSLGPLPSLTPFSLSASPSSAPQPQNLTNPGRGTEEICKGNINEQQAVEWKHTYQGDSQVSKGTKNFAVSAVEAVNNKMLNAEKILGEKLMQLHIPEDDAQVAAVTSVADMGKTTKPAIDLPAVHSKYGPLLSNIIPANNPAIKLPLVQDIHLRPQINQQTIPPNVPVTLSTTAMSSPKDPYEEILQEVLVMFPDVDPSYVLEFLRGQQNGFHLNAVCNYLLETNYPKVKNTAEADCTTVMPTIDYYTYYKSVDGCVNNIYTWQCTELLTTEFKWMSASNIQQVMKLFQYCYAPSHRALQQVWKTAMEKLPAGQSPSGIQFTADIDTDNHQTHITFKLLKRPRKSKTLTLSIFDSQLQREIDFVKLKNMEELKEMDYQLALKMNENEYEELGQQIECGCCYGEFAFESLVQCYDGHLFCTDCLHKYAEESVFGQGKAELSCMTESCKATFPLSQLIKALPSKIISKYEDRIQDENITLADLKDLVKCPFCDFAALLDSAYSVFSCQNSSCMKESCRHCQIEWSEHFGKKCSDVERKDETKLRLEFEEKMTLAKIRVCHKCKTKFTKIDGCNKMTCRCGAKMCYICRKPNIDYNHFCRHPRDPGMACTSCQDCSLWTNPDEDDDRAVREIQLEANKIRKEKGFMEEKLIGAPDEPPIKKIRTAKPES